MQGKARQGKRQGQPVGKAKAKGKTELKAKKAKARQEKAKEGKQGKATSKPGNHGVARGNRAAAACGIIRGQTRPSVKQHGVVQLRVLH